ncbi:8599_t:CDS:2, partial [Ambispora gerdemannii]
PIYRQRGSFGSRRHILVFEVLGDALASDGPLRAARVRRDFQNSLQIQPTKDHKKPLRA